MAEAEGASAAPNQGNINDSDGIRNSDTPPSTAPRIEYARRMLRVFAHIDTHLAAPLELKTLAEVAHFSPYHFHRVFAGWTGETLGDYLRRRRLEVAASYLRYQPRRSVLDVALEVGFGSGEALARAFKLHFGCSPTAWRDSHLRQHQQQHQQQHQPQDQQRHQEQHHSNPDQAGRNPDQALTAAAREHKGFFGHFPDKEHAMNVQLTDLTEVQVASLRHTGPYGPAVGLFWFNEFWPWARAQGLAGSTRYGISYDDPSVTPPAECRYDAAIEAPPGYTAPAPGRMMTLPGGRYAVARFRGTSADIGGAWRWMFREWLPDSGLQVDNRPCFERQQPDELGGAPGELVECDICVPVRTL